METCEIYILMTCFICHIAPDMFVSFPRLRYFPSIIISKHLEFGMLLERFMQNMTENMHFQKAVISNDAYRAQKCTK